MFLQDYLATVSIKMFFMNTLPSGGQIGGNLMA